MRTTQYVLSTNLRFLLLAVVVAIGAGCSSSSTTVENPNDIDANNDGFVDNSDDVNGDGTVDATDVSEFATAHSIDVNGDGILNADDDLDLSGFVDGDDVALYELENPTVGMNDLPDCAVVDCSSNNAVWSDNAPVAQNKSPRSYYAQAVQRLVFCLGYAEDSAVFATFADGVYGPITDAAVEAYQRDSANGGLSVDGEVGPQTWNSLQSQLSATTSSVAAYDAFEITSTQEGCSGVQFYQLIAEPKSWMMARTPGSTELVPMSIAEVAP